MYLFLKFSEMSTVRFAHLVCVFLNITNLFYVFYGILVCVYDITFRGGTQQSLIQGGSALIKGPTPYPSFYLYAIFDRKVPLSHT